MNHIYSFFSFFKKKTIYIYIYSIPHQILQLEKYSYSNIRVLESSIANKYLNISILLSSLHACNYQLNEQSNFRFFCHGLQATDKIHQIIIDKPIKYFHSNKNKKTLVCCFIQIKIIGSWGLQTSDSNSSRSLTIFSTILLHDILLCYNLHQFSQEHIHLFLIDFRIRFKQIILFCT